ncbi:MAG: LysR family transcriptional regulator [Coprobacillus sp.]
MDIKQMIYFKTIVEKGTISKAAQTLHIAQPPLSMQLKQLEEELGVVLLKRGHQKVELTQAGRLFYKRSLQIIALSELTMHEMKDTKQETLRIGITSSNCALIQKIRPYLMENPQLSFRIHEGTTYEIIDLLNAHNIDLGIVRTPFDQSQIAAFPFKREPMVAVGHSEFMNSSMNYIKDYQNTPLIIHQRYFPLLSDYCLKQQFNPFIKISSDDCRTSLIWATEHLGVAIIPKSAMFLIHDTSLVTAVLKDDELCTDIVFITRQHEKLEPRVAEFMQQFFL